jgi:glutamate decarboxylase
MALHARSSGAGRDELDINPLYVREEGLTVPCDVMPPGGMLPDTALQIVRDELIMDGNARLNLATFVTTWMEPQARQLMTECLDKNMIDKDEYPQTAELERRCVNILASLWHAPGSERPARPARAAGREAGSASGDAGAAGRHSAAATGCSTTGSSEACMLGGMALLWRWRARRRAAGLPADTPNLVMGSNVQVCWEKFCRYWQVEPRQVPMAPGRLHLTAEGAAARCDENTIGVVAIMGSTMDGSYEPVREISAALDRLQAERGPDIPVHVDAASGGFVAPFLQPGLEWDFRVPRVASINASGHKYGLVYPGVGWVVWRDASALPEDLVFRVNYLGGDMPTFALNFSRPGAQVAAQYYNFLRLGFDGYRRVGQACQDIALHLSGEIARMGPFELLSDGSDLPVFAFRMRDPDGAGYTVFDLSERLRQRGWLVPAYTFPPDLEHVAVLRIVVRNGLSMDMANLLLDDMRTQVAALEASPGAPVPLLPGRPRGGFAH